MSPNKYYVQFLVSISNPPDCTTLDSSDFDIFIFTDELFTKTLQKLEICL